MNVPDSVADCSMPSNLVALAFVARRLGIHLDVHRVMRDNQISTKSVSLVELMRCAKSAGLRTQGIRPGWHGLLKLAKALPAIISLQDGGSFVLLRVEESAFGQRVLVQDPSVSDKAEMLLDRQNLLSIWDGGVVIVQKDNNASNENQPFDLSLIASLVMRERRMLSDIVISALMMSLLALTPILFFRIASDRVLPFHSMSTFIVLSCVMIIMIAFESSFSGLRRYLLLRLTTRVDVKLSTELFQRVLNLPVEYFERTPAGLTLYKMGQISRVRGFLVGQLFGTLLDGGILLFFVPFMFFISPLLTVIVLAFAGLICSWIVLMLPSYKKRSNAVEAAEANRGSFLSQSIQGIRTVKSLAIESRQADEWDALTAQIARLKFREGNMANLIQIVVTPLERLLVTGSFGLGVYLALTTTDPYFTNTLFTFMLLSQRLAAPLIQASQLIQQYDEARTAIDMIGGLANQSPEQARSVSGVHSEIQGNIIFNGLIFQYKGAIKPALKNVSFEIPVGTTLGVMGRSGSGKTTITRLLQRLNSDYSGLIKVDGIDVRNYDLTHFRRSLGVVLQENFLFSGTIHANITIAKPEASFDEMVHAARLAGAEEFIDKLPNGYETFVYEGSPNLSGGQRQRLAIARALITDPKILILDEATSALDAESEAIVNANIERISQGRTVITISHRLASLVKADAILVMEQGEVNDIGKHHELLERNEIYANLWYTQNPHTSAPAAPRLQLTYRGSQSVA